MLHSIFKKYDSGLVLRIQC